MKNPIDSDADLLSAIEAVSRGDDGAAAREHLAAGFPIYYSEDDTPAGAVIKEYPDGRRELVRFDREGEHLIQAMEPISTPSGPLDMLLARLTPDTFPEEHRFGPPRGNEIW